MWDKAGVKQISPTGRQSPHTYNDSFDHPSYFPERVPEMLHKTRRNCHPHRTWEVSAWPDVPAACPSASPYLPACTQIPSDPVIVQHTTHPPSPAFQPPKRVFVSHLLGWELNVSFLDSWSNVGWKGPQRSARPSPCSVAQREAFAGLAAEDRKVFWSNRGLLMPLMIIWTVGASCILANEWKRHKCNTKEKTSRKNSNGKPNCRK